MTVSEKKDVTGLVYQLIKKVNLLTKRVEDLEKNVINLSDKTFTKNYPE